MIPTRERAVQKSIIRCCDTLLYEPHVQAMECGIESSSTYNSVGYNYSLQKFYKYRIEYDTSYREFLYLYTHFLSSRYINTECFDP